MRVLIVDDEMIVREDLKSLINWEKEGFELVLEASNGAQALEVFNKYYPEIVISDIKMPVKDGIELSKQILKCEKKTQLILLTAYKDFEYARGAIDIGIKSFILKHEMTRESMLNALNNAKTELDRSNYIDEIHKNDLFKNLLMIKSLKDNEIKKLQYDMNKFFIEKKSYYAAVLLIDNYRVQKMKSDNEGWKNTIYNFQNYLQTIQLKCCNIEYISGGDHCFYLIISAFPLFNEMKERNTAFKIGEELTTLIMDELSQNVTVAISRSSRNLLSLYSLMGEAERLAYMKALSAKRSVIYFGDIGVSNNKTIETNLNVELDQINQAVRNSDIEYAIKMLRTILNKNILKHNDIEGLNKLIEGLMWLSNGIIDDYSLRDYECYNAIKDFYDKLNMYDTFEDISDNMENLLKALNLAISLVTSLNYCKMIREAIKYIHKNFMNNLSLNDLSKELQISKVYISQLFKKETGQNFIDYLTTYRIEKAKELLKTGNYKIYEIPEKVGFSNLQYFSAKFKSVVGMTPNEYKNHVA
ncbi:MAG: response regulator [Clostridia bacterium]|nr:response regulator [Clostridia bacterium]